MSQHISWCIAMTNVTVWLCNAVDDAPDYSMLSQDELDVAKEIVCIQTRQIYLHAKRRLRQILAEQTGIAANAIRFDYSPYGKPLLRLPAGFHKAVYFNVSHTKRTIAIAVCPSHPIGIDVEELSNSSSLHSSSDIFCSAAEKKLIFACPDSQRDHLCLVLWTRKEAFLKATGVGLSRSPHTVDVTMPRNENILLYSYRHVDTVISLGCAHSEASVSFITVQQKGSPIMTKSILEHSENVSSVRDELSQHYSKDEFSITRNQTVHIVNTLAEQIRNTAHRTPERTAIISNDHHYTFHTLLTQAEKVARHLIAQGIRKGERVAVLCDHGIDMVTGMLGCMLANIIYVPLDPDYPESRLRMMLQAAFVSGCLHDDAHLNLAIKLNDIDCMLINLHTEEFAASKAPLPSISLDDPVYLLFTSGSTGTPKWALQTHRNVMVQVTNHIHALSLSPNDRLSLISSFCFDASVTDLYAGLCIGASVITMNAKKMGFDDITHSLVQHQVTVWHSTPTAFRKLITSLKTHRSVPPLRVLLLGGEAVFAHDVTAAVEYISADCIFINGYGTTEASFMCQNIFRAADYSGGVTVPVGFPIPGFTFHIRTSDTDEGKEGELRVTSPFLATWGHISEKIPTHIAEPLTEKSYATGDIVTYSNTDGLCHSGRKDHQVKLRGYRIDLTEIEGNLATFEGIVTATVGIWQLSNADEPLLSAWIVNKKGYRLNKLEIRRHIAQILPDYMVPALITFIDAMPLTPSGKVDRKKLPSPHEGLETLTLSREMTVAEQRIAFLIKNRLGVLNTDPDFSFFELGLTSLMLAELYQHLVETQNITFPLHKLFEYPSISKLACFIEGCSVITTTPSSITSINARLEKRQLARKKLI
ncbi:AMP-binding protein [Pantoea stewartii]|uniref:AMP-binding protein n=1 Tax=Pantoea stewartii TaxID=66269 RepID=UPI0024BDE6DC|nr:AMP-binding protein [Pantoea stewartii]